MPKYVDFAELKATTDIENVISLLQVPMARNGHQWRGRCPACESDSDRALVVTPAKQAFYCFSDESGGDVIAFVAHILGVSMKSAADYLIEDNETSCHHNPPPESLTEPKSFEPLDYLVANHPKVSDLGVTPETCEHFGAGYAPKGILRGRLAIPIHNAEGILQGYCGRAVTDDQQPTLLFPKGLSPNAYRFNLHRLKPGECHCFEDPLKAMLAHQCGVENVIAILLDVDANVVSLPVKQRV